jgi:tripartite-type tricarboxylate transporter receptor subunit TctC
MNIRTLLQATALMGACLAASAALAQAAAPSAAQVQAYPEKSVQMIIPYPPGQAIDVIGRILAEGLGKEWKHGVFVDNRAGGASIPGMVAGRDAAPDGYSLTLASVGPIAINPAVYPKLPYDPLKDYTLVNGVFAVPLVFVVPEASPIHTLKDLLEHARKNPKKLDIGIPGPATIQHVAAELLKLKSGVEMTAVAYKGSGPMLNDLLGGHIPTGVESVTSALPFIRGGKLRAVAVTAPQRVPQLPDVPTVAEQGFPGFEAVGWVGLLAPRNLPAPLVDKIAAQVQGVLAQPDVQAKIRDNGAIVDARGPAPWSAFVRKELDVWRTTIRQAQIKVD